MIAMSSIAPMSKTELADMVGATTTAQNGARILPRFYEDYMTDKVILEVMGLDMKDPVHRRHFKSIRRPFTISQTKAFIEKFNS